MGNDNFAHIHVSLVPVVGAVGEPKSKPTQHGVRELRAAGLQPDLIICRSTRPLDRGVISKISQFCMVPPSHVISVHDVSNIYKVPLLLDEQRVGSLVLNCLRLHRMPPDDSHLSQWRRIADDSNAGNATVRIGIVGKYTGLSDSYLSVTKSIDHAAMACRVNAEIVWIDSSALEDSTRLSKQERYAAAWDSLRSLQGILIPGGFGNRGVDGKVAAIRYAREQRVPFLGICLGMQVAVMEFALNVCGVEGATSGEFDEAAAHQVVVYMPEISREHMGGTMRLGARTTLLSPHTLASALYSQAASISERHRHRYEVNPDYLAALSAGGLLFSGKDESGRRMECIELAEETHPFFFGCQYHPEFQSRPFRPSPPFYGFVAASAGKWVRKDREATGAAAGKNGTAAKKVRSKKTATAAAAPGGGGSADFLNGLGAAGDSSTNGSGSDGSSRDNSPKDDKDTKDDGDRPPAANGA